MTTKLQSSKLKTKLKSYEKNSEYCDEMNYQRQNGTFQFTEDVFNRNAQVIGKNYQEVLI